MADPVTVEHGGVTITTNTATEADLRAEMTREAPTPDAGPAAPAAAAPVPPEAAPGRDDKGRFVKRETAAPVPAATPPETPPGTEAAPAEGSPDEEHRHSPLTRMKKALAQKAAAEKRAAALEAELTRLRQPAPAPVTPPAAPAVPTDGEPQYAQFVNDPAYAADPYTAYLQAWTRWNNAQETRAALAAYQAEQTAKSTQAAFEARISEGAKAYPDWQTVLTEADTLGLQVSAVMRDAITASPRAADLVYYLAHHPEECMQLAEESESTPVAAAPVMRRLLEAQLGPRVSASNGAGTAARPATSTAKPPVTPVGSSPVVSDAPPGDEASAAEHARYWNRKLKVPGTPR